MHKINFLEEMKKGHYLGGVYHSPKKPRFLKYLMIFMVILSVTLFSFSWQVFSSYQDNRDPKNQEGGVGIIENIGRSIKNLVTFGSFKIGNKNKLQGEPEDKINILLLGVGGKGHDGAYLSDTIILASVEPSTNKIALLSIPRDLYVPIGDRGWHKINHASAYGEAEKTGHGAELAQETVSKIFGVPVHYYVRVDFDGFKQIIDDVGKVKIYIENSFTDKEYPDNNYGYDPVSFSEGWEIMDGDRALKYARSRHGDNGEGSDFSRSRRQQKVLAAVKEKINSLSFWLNPKKVGQVLADLDNHITTNMESWEIISLAKIVKNSNLDNINHTVLTEGPDDELYASIVNGEYVLLPKGNDFTPLKILAKNIFSDENDKNINQDSLNEKKEIISIEIQNGTTITGLASKISKDLKQEGFLITKIGNASVQDYEQTIIYNLTQASDPEKIKFLENEFNATATNDIPSNLINKNITGLNINGSTNNLTDVIIILGENTNK